MTSYAVPTLLLVSTMKLASCSTLGGNPDCEGIAADYRRAVNAFTPEDLRWTGMVMTQVAYGGQCGCPDDLDERGQICGERSAYTRSGGARPICDPSAIPDHHLAIIRARIVEKALPRDCGGGGLRSYLQPVGGWRPEQIEALNRFPVQSAYQ